jgi:hypothetical protein
MTVNLRMYEKLGILFSRLTGNLRMTGKLVILEKPFWQEFANEENCSFWRSRSDWEFANGGNFHYGRSRSGWLCERIGKIDQSGEAGLDRNLRKKKKVFF